MSELTDDILDSLTETYAARTWSFGELRQEIKRLERRAKDAFRYAYEQGHHDTVESQYMGCGDADSECYEEWLKDYLAEQEQG